MSATTTAYVPRPGSIGQRAIEHLNVHGRKSIRDLADAIDADVAVMDASMSLCVRRGLVERDEVDGFVYFELPAPVGIMQSEHGPVEDDKPKFSCSWPPNSSVDEILQAEVPAQPVVADLDAIESYIRADLQRRDPDVTPAPPAKRHFEFGLFSDGRLVIELDDTVTTLERAETERLFKFVQGIEGALDAAA